MSPVLDAEHAAFEKGCQAIAKIATRETRLTSPPAAFSFIV
jgi:hypothetical protein